MNRQADELKKLMGYEEETQLKEMFDEFNAEDKADKEELEKLRAEHNEISSLLDSYGIPGTSVIERLKLALLRCA